MNFALSRDAMQKKQHDMPTLPIINTKTLSVYFCCSKCVCSLSLSLSAISYRLSIIIIAVAYIILVSLHIL